jgi:hypothetical protein
MNAKAPRHIGMAGVPLAAAKKPLGGMSLNEYARGDNVGRDNPAEGGVYTGTTGMPVGCSINNGK